MKIMIQLTPEDWDCLLEHVPNGSGTYAALKNATDLHGYINMPPLEFVVYCDENEAKLLLDTAKNHCPTAVRAIEEAIKVAPAEQR